MAGYIAATQLSKPIARVDRVFRNLLELARVLEKPKPKQAARSGCTAACGRSLALDEIQATGVDQRHGCRSTAHAALRDRSSSLRGRLAVRRPAYDPARQEDAVRQMRAAFFLLSRRKATA